MSKRATTALEILLQRGSVTTAELSDLGYDHPPRAIGDLKDAGLTVVAAMVNVEGRRMARYTLLDTQGGTEAIRRQLPKQFRDSLFAAYANRCAVCGGRFGTRELQVDHRLPFRIAGDPEILVSEDFMPLCGSDNRSKSMTCEKCVNWNVKDVNMCKHCYWAHPENYSHIAGEPERRLTLSLRGEDVATFDRLAEQAAQAGQSVGDWVADRLSDLQ